MCLERSFVTSTLPLILLSPGPMKSKRQLSWNQLYFNNENIIVEEYTKH